MTAALTPDEVHDHELRHWQDAAEGYAELTGFATSLGGQADLVVRLGMLDGTQQVLDVGCGPGQLSGLLARHAAEVVGVDFAPNMVSAARVAHPDLQFEIADAAELPFPDGAFDVAVCNYLAHHLARPLEAFTEIRRVLRRDGTLVVISPVQSQQVSLGVLVRAATEVLGPMGDPYPGGPLAAVEDPEVYVELLRRAGFVDCTVRIEPKPLIQPDLSTLLRALWAITGLDDADVRGQVSARVRELAEAHRRPDGAFAFPDVVLTARARRPGPESESSSSSSSAGGRS